MGTIDNGKDCKHRSIDIALGRNQINCRRCGESLDKDKVIAITKAQHNKMQAVVDLARKKRKLYKEWETMKYEGETDNRFLVFTDKKDAVWKTFKETLAELDKALDALKESEDG